MIYELQLDKENKIINAQVKGGPWGKKEVAPDFSYIEKDLTEKQVKRLIGTYKHKKEKFINIKNGEEFDNELLFEDDDFENIGLLPNKKERENWCSSLDTDWKSKQESPCLFLHAWHTGIDPHTVDGWVRIRKYWFNKFQNFKKLDGMTRLLIYSLYGDYAMIGQCMNQLPKETSDAWWKSDVFTNEDKSYMKWLSKL